MPDDPRARLAEEAGLDERARIALAALPDDGADQLLAAWHGAVVQQDAVVDDAIEGSLSLLPRIVRSRVMKLLRRGR